MILAGNQSFNTVSELRTSIGTPKVQVLLSGLLAEDDSNGGTYQWDENSTATDNNFTVIQVTGVVKGRWKRIGNGNTLKGSRTLSGAVLQTAYTVNYDAVLPFTPITVIIIPRSANAAVPSWVSSITNTGFTVNFSSVPILGTNNIVLDFIVVKQ